MSLFFILLRRQRIVFFKTYSDIYNPRFIFLSHVSRYLSITLPFLYLSNSPFPYRLIQRSLYRLIHPFLYRLINLSIYRRIHPSNYRLIHPSHIQQVSRQILPFFLCVSLRSILFHLTIYLKPNTIPFLHFC